MHKIAAILFLLVSLGSQAVYAHSDLHEVIARLDRQIQASPDNVGLLLERAAALRLHGDYKKAIQDVEQVRKLRPEVKDGHLVMAEIYRAQKKWNQAKEEVDLFITSRPEHSGAYVLRGQLCEQLELFAQAEKDIYRAIELTPRAPMQLYRSYIDLLLRRNDVEAALMVFDEAEKSMGPLPMLLESKAQMLKKLGRFNDASAVYAQMRIHYPTLGFNWWIEEAQMWETHDKGKARQAYISAEHTWHLLPARTRALQHMKEQREVVRAKLKAMGAE